MWIQLPGLNYSLPVVIIYTPQLKLHCSYSNFKNFNVVEKSRDLACFPPLPLQAHVYFYDTCMYSLTYNSYSCQLTCIGCLIKTPRYTHDFSHAKGNIIWQDRNYSRSSSDIVALYMISIYDPLYVICIVGNTFKLYCILFFTATTSEDGWFLRWNEEFGSLKSKDLVHNIGNITIFLLRWQF